jgi:hypothetical protein
MAESIDRGDRGKRVRWEAVLRQFAAGGLSVREFCRRRGLSEPSFYAWRRRLRTEGGPAAPASPAAPLFVPLRVAAGRAAATAAGGGGGEQARIELLLGGGVTVRLFGEVPAARLVSVLGVLSGHNGGDGGDGKEGGPC